jgi:hypothetical protein
VDEATKPPTPIKGTGAENPRIVMPPPEVSLTVEVPADVPDASLWDRILPAKPEADSFNLGVAARPGWTLTQRLATLPFPPPPSRSELAPSYHPTERHVAADDELTPAARSSSPPSTFVQDWVTVSLLVFGVLALLGVCLLLAAICGLIRRVPM